MVNVADSILSRGRPAAPAVIHRGEVVSHESLRRSVTHVAASLLARGHSKGDRVGICSENNAFFIAAYLGIIRAGLVAVPFQAELNQELFAEIVLSADIKDALVSGRLATLLGPWAEESGVDLVSESDLILASETAPGLPSTNDSCHDLAALMFTSGSTGSHKGVMVTHQNIECNTRDIISYLGLSNEDRAMVVLPFCYCFGLSLLHSLLMAGGSIVLNNEFRLFPEATLREMQTTKCTGFAGVPSTFQLLLRKSRFRQMRFPSLRWLQQAGGRLPNSHIREILDSFPQIRFYLMYGQTEATARLSYLPPERLADKLGSIGKGLPSTRLEVIKQDGTPVQPGSPETGEIVASGANITQGYWNDPAETDRFFKSGKLHTGDIARVDSDGYIFLLGRNRDFIKSRGNRVSAQELEEVIAEIPEIVEVAVVGLPHELLGESINACVVVAPHSRITPEAVKAYCFKRLPPFKIPTDVCFLDHMPHNGSGKILKKQLMEYLEAGNLDARTSDAAGGLGGSKDDEQCK